MERMRQIYSEQIEPYTDTFGRLSRCLMHASVLASVLSAMQALHPPYTRACARRFLSHYMVRFYSDDVVGDAGETMAARVAQSAASLFTLHLERSCPTGAFVEALGAYLRCFDEWQRFDKAKLASTYRDVYRLLSEIKVSSPIEVQEPVEKLQRTIDQQTQQIFGADAHKLRQSSGDAKAGDCEELARFVHSSVHDAYWEEMTRKVARNEFDALCDVIGHVKDRMVALCASPQKREEVGAFLDVAFLHNVLHVGMAQTQVRSLLSYCLRFLREYGAPCHDGEIAALLRTADALYTVDTIDPSSAVATLVGVIREIAQRVDALVGVVCQLSADMSTEHSGK
jgi:hypothetical protein